MLTIHGPARSRASRVIWAAEELQIPYELKVLNMMEGEHRRPEFLKINPNGKVPVIVDGDFTLSESGAILNYLADKNSSRGLIPSAGTKERALHDQWMMFALNDLEPPLWAWFKQVLFVPEEKRSTDLHKEATACFERSTAALSQHLSRQNYLLGDTFGMADLLTTSILGWGRMCKMPGMDDVIQGYLTRNTQRPAYKIMAEKYFK